MLVSIVRIWIYLLTQGRRPTEDLIKVKPMIALVRKYISSHLSLPTLANGLLATLYIYVMQHNEGCARTWRSRGSFQSNPWWCQRCRPGFVRREGQRVGQVSSLFCICTKRRVLCFKTTLVNATIVSHNYQIRLFSFFRENYPGINFILSSSVSPTVTINRK